MRKCVKGHKQPGQYKRECPYCVSVVGFKAEDDLREYMQQKYGKKKSIVRK